MPWTSGDALEHTKKANTPKKQSAWAKIANKALADCEEKGQGDCEGRAIRIANSAVAKMKEAEPAGPDTCVCPECDYSVEKKRGVPCRSMKCPECGATLIAGDEGGNAMELGEVARVKVGDATVTVSDLERAYKATFGEAEWTTAYVNTLPDASFALILPGGKKDDEGKTAPRNLRKLPYKDKSGKVDIPHLRNALARIKHVKGASSALIASALKKLQAAAKTHLKTHQEEHGEIDDPELLELAELAEFYGDEAPVYAAGALSFSDLKASIEARKAAREIRELTYNFQEIVSNILALPTEDNKVGRIRVLANEFVALVEELMTSPTEEAEGPVIEYLDESDDAIIEEFKFEEAGSLGEESGVIVNILEAEGDITPTNPLKLHVALIEPGWGNKKHMNYYPASVLERDAHIFKGCKMYTTDHKPGEINEPNEVSVIMDVPIGFTAKGAPIAEVGVFDPLFAAKCRNRAALGQLHTLNDSIRAKGMRRKGSADGTEGFIVESLDKGFGVDWVSSPGAGGHAVSLAESETGGEFMDKKQVKAALAKSKLTEEQQDKLVKIEYADEAALEEAILTESKAPEKEDSEKGKPEKTTPKEAATEPVFLSESNVAEILQQTRLPIVSKARIASEKYPTKEALWEAVMAETSYVKELTGSGNPFYHGQSMSEEDDRGKRESTYQEDLARIDKEFGLAFMEAPGGK